MNFEVTYERNIHKSYMKIPSEEINGLDEKLIFYHRLEGIIPCEKCKVNGKVQYWYDISGKQALDNYCKVHMIGQNLFEQLLLRICNQLELLEWNLIDGKCLILRPEFIFLNHNAEEISFVLYPTEEGDIFKELREFMEYLLTKLNHQEKNAVHAVYELYEVILTEGFSIEDLKNRILERRRKEVSVEPIEVECEYQEIIIKELKGVLKEPWGEGKRRKKELTENIPDVIHPEDEEIKARIDIHPTVCLSSILEDPKGILIYEGIGDYPDFEIGERMCVIGKSQKATIQIEKETISQFHAKIEYIVDNYYIEDMNSTNGTFVNDEILNYKQRILLNAGDVIRFADIKYRFL